MPPLADRSIEAILDELQAAVRSLQSGSLLNRASVVNADGRYVTLSQLAFGQVVARDSGQVTLTQNVATWFDGAPVLDVFVQGGRLRVDVAGWLIVGGLNLRLSMSYSVTGPSPAGLADGGGPRVVAPDNVRSLALESKGNAASYQLAAGFPDLVEGLAPGWYRVRGAYQLVGEVNPAPDTFGYVINRRIFATPL